MVKIAAAKRGRGRGAGAAAGRGSRGGARGAGRGGGKGGGRGGGSGGGTQTLQTGKGTFVFQRVTDGLYIEHQWGKNSGHIGVAQESLAAFAKKIMSIAESSGAVSCRTRAQAPSTARHHLLRRAGQVKKADKPKAKGKTLGVAAKGKGIAKKVGQRDATSYLTPARPVSVWLTCAPHACRTRRRSRRWSRCLKKRWTPISTRISRGVRPVARRRRRRRRPRLLRRERGAASTRHGMGCRGLRTSALTTAPNELAPARRGASVPFRSSAVFATVVSRQVWHFHLAFSLYFFLT